MDPMQNPQVLQMLQAIMRGQGPQPTLPPNPMMPSQGQMQPALPPNPMMPNTDQQQSSLGNSPMGMLGAAPPMVPPPAPIY